MAQVARESLAGLGAGERYAWLAALARAHHDAARLHVYIAHIEGQLLGATQAAIQQE